MTQPGTTAVFAGELKRGHMVFDAKSRGDGVVFKTLRVDHDNDNRYDKVYVWFYGNSYAAEWWIDDTVIVSETLDQTTLV